MIEILIKPLKSIKWVILALIVIAMTDNLESCKNIKHYQWIENDSTIVTMDITGDTSKEYEGDAKAYYPSGQLYISGHLKNYKKNGLQVYYYPNGKVKKRQYFKNNLKDGLNEVYYESGHIKVMSFYTNDTLNGLHVFYYPSGKIGSYVLYVNGEQIYYCKYDSLGQQTKEHWGGYYEATKSINLSDSFKVKFTLPIIKGLYSSKNFIIGVYPIMIKQDSLANCDLLGEIQDNGEWQFYLLNQTNKKKKMDVTVKLLTVNEKGEAYFRFKPETRGKYVLKVVLCNKMSENHLSENHRDINFIVQ